MLWSGLIAKRIYRKYLGSLRSDTVNRAAAILFYLLFIAGIFVFVIYPSMEKQPAARALVFGAFFGLEWLKRQLDRAADVARGDRVSME